ncbi:MAG: DUF89 domain-containing protein [Promethearchaeota archaeon]
MKLEPECIGCLFDQILNALKLLKPDISREKIIFAQKKFIKSLIDLDIENKAAPMLGKIAYSIVAEVLGEEDPYYSLKGKYNRLALQYYEEVMNIIENSEDPLLEAIFVAAIGNTVDFASQHKIDLISDIRNFKKEDLFLNDYTSFKQSLNKSNHLLIIGDNSGEIVFDKLLIKTILDLYPDMQIIYSVRSVPIVNDATIEDAKYIGLTDLVEIVESGSIPGVDITTSPKEFKKHFYHKGGVILSKGQGNFECLYGMEIPDKDLYYLLKVKCKLMERIFNAKIGNLIFKKKIKNF